jgi:hypothetical protein
MRTVVKAIAATAFAALLGIATQASAVLITVAEEGGWTVSDNDNDSFSGAPADNVAGVDGTTGRFTNAGWFANSDPKSQLILEFFSSTQDVPTNGTPVQFLIARISQDNQIIFLADSDPPVVSPYIHTLAFAGEFRIISSEGEEFADSPTGSVTHTETMNSGGCTEDGSLNAAGSTCDDIYSFILSLAPPADFMIGDVTYTFGFSLAPSEGTVIGEDGRIYTPEGGDNFVDVLVTIQAVPEPGTLALLGLGLVGFGFAVRRGRTA